MRPVGVRLAVVAAAVVALGGCRASADAGAPAGVQATDGFEVRVVSTALSGPTQVLRGPDGRLWVAELNGGEDERTGRVVALADDGSVDEVLLAGLDKPTGIAVVGEALWVLQRRSLGRAVLRDGGVGPLEVVLDDLPSNGRSETTLTATGDGRLLYATTGASSGAVAREGSGVLWRLDPDDPTSPEAVATGFKNAYAHVEVDGGVVVTEVADGPFDGETPPDELNLVRPGDDGGWPRCRGERQPVEEFGVTAADCVDTVAPLALFAPGATPTGLARLGDDWLVALWAAGEVVAVPVDGGQAEPWLTGVTSPQHLLVEDGRVYLTDHVAGRLLVVVPG